MREIASRNIQKRFRFCCVAFNGHEHNNNNNHTSPWARWWSRNNEEVKWTLLIRIGEKVKKFRWSFAAIVKISFIAARERVRWRENKGDDDGETWVATSCCSLVDFRLKLSRVVRWLTWVDKAQERTSHFRYCRCSLRCGDYWINYSFLPQIFWLFWIFVLRIPIGNVKSYVEFEWKETTWMKISCFWHLTYFRLKTNVLRCFRNF